MSTTTPMTAEQLLTLSPSGRCELVEGELRMMSPSGWKHSDIAGRLHAILGHHIVENGLGMVMGADPGFLIHRDPDTVLAPDVAFIARANLPAVEPSAAFWPGAPDLAVEVLSPNDRTGEVDEKIEAWLSAGTKLLWVVDPKLRNVTVYRTITDVTVLTVNDVLDGGDIVPDFRCPVRTIFNL